MKQFDFNRKYLLNKKKENIRRILFFTFKSKALKTAYKKFAEVSTTLTNDNSRDWVEPEKIIRKMCEQKYINWDLICNIYNLTKSMDKKDDFQYAIKSYVDEEFREDYNDR